MTLVSRLSTLLIVLLLVGCSQEKVQVIEGPIYGTTYSVQFTEDIDKGMVKKLIKTELDRIDMVFSTYKTDSEISQFNNCTSKGGDWTLHCYVNNSEEFRALRIKARNIKSISMGAFDPEPEKEIYDFSAIGKGYAVDKIAELLMKNDIYNYFIDIGGEISINGTKYGEAWTWGINDPFSSHSRPYIAFEAPESGISVATSGEYRNPGHIWGEGPKDAASVTVIDVYAVDADAWATAMYVLGIEEGLEIAEKEGLAVFFIKNDGKSINSSEWSKIYP
jgi:thiamine biosynthesis lipoprotein|tara:strand:- start:248 stop:1078 length:831 start_codon:yes stop_codon:yes gene_type:complete